MKAIQFDRYGPPEVLALVDGDEPHPQAGQIRIRVRAAGVNGLDGKIRGYPIPVETALRGGVGTAVVQIARGRGITVIGTTSAANQDYLRDLGAVPTTYGDGFVDRVHALAPNGIDAALDISGSGVIGDCIALTGDPSKVVSIADFTAVQQGAQISFQPTDIPAALREAATLYAQGALRIPVENTFTLADSAAAQAHNDAGHAAGRTIVTVPEPAA